MPIPTIPNTAPVQDVQIGTKVDSRFQQGVISAQANVFSEAMGVVSDYEQRKQKAEEAAGFNAASITLNKATADYQHNLKMMPDKDIVPQWQQTSQKVKDDLLKTTEGWSGPAKRKFSQTLDTWQSDSTIQFQVAGDHLASQRRKATAIAASQEFLQTGDESLMGNAKAALTTAKNAGDMTQAEYDQHVSALTRGLQTNQILNGIESDPVATLRDIDAGEFKDVPAKQLLQLKGTARRAVVAVQNAGRDDLLQRHDAGEIIDEGEISAMESTGAISARGAKQVRLGIAQKDYKDARDNRAMLMLEADDTLTADNPDLDKKAQSIKDDGASLPPVLRRYLYEHVDAKVKAATKGAGAEERPVEQQIFSQMREDRMSNGYTLPVSVVNTPGSIQFWNSIKSGSVVRDEGTSKQVPIADSLSALRDPNKVSDEQIKDAFGKDMTREKLIRAEQLHAAQISEKMHDWFKDPANAKATYEQANDYRLELEKPFVMGQVTAALTQGNSAYKTTKDVQMAFKAGQLSRSEAEKILKEQFGLK